MPDYGDQIHELMAPFLPERRTGTIQRKVDSAIERVIS